MTARTHPLGRLRRARPQALPLAQSFDDVPEAQIYEVTLRGNDAPLSQSRSVQSTIHPNLLAGGRRPMHRLRVAVVPRARLATTSGCVITNDGRLVFETLWDQDHLKREFEPPPVLPAARHVSGRHAALVSVWSHNYHHWMFEALPRLAVLQASGVTFDKLIVPAPTSAFHRETLEMAGFGVERLLPFTSAHIAVDELVWPTPLAPFEQPTRYMIDWLRDLAGVTDSEPTERYYIPRRDSRRVVNEPEVVAELKRARFRVFDPSGLSSRDQFRRFASAEAVVGPHGAAFSNAIFSPRLKALEFFHDRRVNVSTTAAIVAAGHEHWSLMCPRVWGPHRPQNQNLRVPISELRETLAAMGMLSC